MLQIVKHILEKPALMIQVMFVQMVDIVCLLVIPYEGKYFVDSLSNLYQSIKVDTVGGVNEMVCRER